MQLIARLSVHRHLIDDAHEQDPGQGLAKSVAIFRVLGRSPERALKVLAENTTWTTTKPSVALALPSNALSADQAEVCKAVISECRNQAMEIVVCGSDPRQMHGRVASEFSTNRWFPTVQEMVQQLGKEDGRHANRKPDSDEDGE